MPTRQFIGFYGNPASKYLEDFIYIELFSERVASHNWLIKPHVHSDLFQLFLITAGAGEVLGETEKIPFQAPAYVVVPTNVPHGFVFSTDVQGAVFTMADFKLEYLTKNNPAIITALARLHVCPTVAGDAHDVFIYEALCQCLREHGHDEFGKGSVLQHYMGLVLVHLCRALPLGSRPPGADKSSQRYFREFTRLVRGEFSANKSVEAYAGELKISPGHLNRICKAVCGKSAKDVLLDYLVEQAKTSLQYSTATVSEVAYQLDFKDVGYFSRFFKKRTGTSPLDFRKAANAAPG